MDVAEFILKQHDPRQFIDDVREKMAEIKRTKLEDTKERIKENINQTIVDPESAAVKMETQHTLNIGDGDEEISKKNSSGGLQQIAEEYGESGDSASSSGRRSSGGSLPIDNRSPSRRDRLFPRSAHRPGRITNDRLGGGMRIVVNNGDRISRKDTDFGIRGRRESHKVRGNLSARFNDGRDGWRRRRDVERQQIRSSGGDYKRINRLELLVDRMYKRLFENNNRYSERKVYFANGKRNRWP